MPLPLTGSSMTVGFDVAERPAPPSARPSSDIAIVSPGFFQTAGIPLLEAVDSRIRTTPAIRPY